MNNVQIRFQDRKLENLRQLVGYSEVIYSIFFTTLRSEIRNNLNTYKLQVATPTITNRTISCTARGCEQ